MGSIAPPETHVVLLALPAFGHVRPAIALASSLVALGYTVTVITGSTSKSKIEAIKGVEFVPLKGKADVDFEQPLSERFPDRPKDNTVLFDMEKVFFDGFDDQFETVKEVIERPDLRDRRVVLVQDGTFVGTIPMTLGSSHIRRVPLIGLGHFPLGILSKDTAPFNSGMPSMGEEVNIKMNEGAIEMFAGLMDFQKSALQPYNCTESFSSRWFFDNWVSLCDIYCQLSIPAMEPPRSDLPENIRFCGALTGFNGNIASKTPHPQWFQDFVLDDTTTHPLILVTSGSLPGQNINHLILPTIQACKDLPVRIIVCAVHVKFPAGEELPPNVRWATWIPFEDIFPHTSLVISSGGYGGVNQAFANGIPMVLAGMTEDKAHVGMLAAATGAAINLKTQTPSVEQVRDAVLEILMKESGSYKAKAEELKKAYAGCDPIGSVVEAIEEVSSKFYGEGPGQAVAGSQRT